MVLCFFVYKFTILFPSARQPRPHERYVCGYGGERRCGQSVDSPLAELQLLELVDGFFCEEGFVRNEDGECVTSAECGCKYHNQKGETLILKVSHMSVCLYLFICMQNVKSGYEPALPIRICFVWFMNLH